jgi:elongation factor Ts
MAITADLVKKLREITDAPMMDCKKALEKTGGNIDDAVAELRKSGQAKAAKKADRTAAEGTIIINLNTNQHDAVMLEVNCETDFVARDSNFLAFAKDAAHTALVNKITDATKLSQLPISDKDKSTIEEARQHLIAKIGENIQIRRAAAIHANTPVAHYVHSQRIGVLVQLEGGDTQLGKDLAMHIAASNPQVISPENVSQDLIAKEKEIFMAQAQSSGKPADIIEKMIGGRIKKFLDEVSLLGQPFVKNPDQTVAQVLKAANAKVVHFVRFEVGEGIEKKVENFAEEVMAQVRGS